MPFSSTIIVLIMPAIPLAPSRCPMLDLTAPLGVFRVSIARTGYSQSAETHMYNGSSGLRCSRNTPPIALASVGSPTAVPVPFRSQCQHGALSEGFRNIPCASKYRVAPGSKPAFS